MSIMKRIICLANSRKLSGRCIAGKEILPDERLGGWVRPVSDRENEEVSEYERQYENGSDPRVLDVIRMPLLNPKPRNYQRENWLLDPERYWEKIGQITPNQLEQFTDQAAPLWNNDYSSSNGLNDRIPLQIANSLNNSLRLIRINKLELVVSQPGIDFGNYRRSVQGRFEHFGMEYWLRITDPVYERDYLQQPNGNYSIGECFLTVSIGEPYRGYSYKLIAAIISL